MKQHNFVKRLAFKADGYSNALCVISQILAAKLNLADVEMSIIAKNPLKTAHCANLKADTGKPLLFIRHPPTYMGPKAVSAEVAINMPHGKNQQESQTSTRLPSCQSSAKLIT